MLLSFAGLQDELGGSDREELTRAARVFVVVAGFCAGLVLPELFRLPFHSSVSLGGDLKEAVPIGAGGSAGFKVLGWVVLEFSLCRLDVGRGWAADRFVPRFWGRSREATAKCTFPRYPITDTIEYWTWGFRANGA